MAGVLLFQYGTRDAAIDQVRAELERVAAAAAATIDGDLHRDLPGNVPTTDPDYQRLLSPLVDFHRSFPNLYYVFTGRQNAGRSEFLLDTAVVLKDSFPKRTLVPSLPGESYNSKDPAGKLCMESGNPTSSAGPYTGPFGTFITGYAPIRDSSGAIVGIVGVDIEGRDFEDSLAWTWSILWGGLALAVLSGCGVGVLTGFISRRSVRAEALVRDVLDSHSSLVLRFSTNGQVLYANQAFLAFSRVGQDPWEGRKLADLLHSEDAALANDLLRPRSQQESQWENEAVLHCHGGTIRTFRWSCRSSRNENGGAYIQAVGQDVTELRVVQERLEESEQRHRLMVENASDIVTMMERDGTFTYQSPSVKHVLGYDDTELLGKSVYDIVHPDDAKSIRWVLSYIDKKKPIMGRRWRIRYRHKGGNWVLLESMGTNCLDQPAFKAIVVISRDVTERQRMIDDRDRQNRILSQSQSAAKIGGLSFDNESGLLFWTDETYNILETSPESFELSIDSGVSFFVGKSKTELQIAMRRCSRKGTPFNIVAHARTAKGRDIVVRAIGMPQKRGEAVVGVFGSMQDISEMHRQQQERTRLEEQMRQAQRLESLGVLAGGIAHDFNNLLTGVLGNASLLALDLPPGAEVPKPLTQIELSARRAADLCKQLVAYSGQRAVDSKAVEIDPLIRETSGLVSHSVSKKAEIVLETNSPGVTVFADSTQLQQVFMNLIINASEALTHGEGKIRVQTSVIDARYESDAGFHLLPAEFKGRYLDLKVTDNGAGMAPETLLRIFDPFFTTKFTGRGLGLAAVRGIVQAHRGALKVTSSPGNGTTFRILFPVNGEPAPSQPNSKPVEPGQNATPVRQWWQGEGKVLVADDEEPIRLLTRQLLRRHGFAVRAAVDGEDALEAFYQGDGEFVAAVLDITMPKLGGEEVLGAIRSSHPRMPVVMISGYTELAEKLDDLRDRHTAFLAKPFSTEEFSAALKGVMENSASL